MNGSKHWCGYFLLIFALLPSILAEPEISIETAYAEDLSGQPLSEIVSLDHFNPNDRQLWYQTPRNEPIIIGIVIINPTSEEIASESYSFYREYEGERKIFQHLDLSIPAYSVGRARFLVVFEDTDPDFLTITYGLTINSSTGTKEIEWPMKFYLGTESLPLTPQKKDYSLLAGVDNGYLVMDYNRFDAPMGSFLLGSTNKVVIGIKNPTEKTLSPQDYRLIQISNGKETILPSVEVAPFSLQKIENFITFQLEGNSRVQEVGYILEVDDENKINNKALLRFRALESQISQNFRSGYSVRPDDVIKPSNPANSEIKVVLGETGKTNETKKRPRLRKVQPEFKYEPSQRVPERKLNNTVLAIDNASANEKAMVDMYKLLSELAGNPEPRSSVQAKKNTFLLEKMLNWLWNIF